MKFLTQILGSLRGLLQVQVQQGNIREAKWNIHGFVSISWFVCGAHSDLLPTAAAAVCENGLKISGSPSDCPSVRVRSVAVASSVELIGEGLNLWKNATDMNEIKWRW